MKAPCKGCDRRTAECHANCKEYQEFQKENEEIKKNRKKDTISRSAMFRASYYN